MTCINWVRVRNGARPGPFRGWRSSSGSRTIVACRVGRCSIFLSRKKGQTYRGFPLSWRSTETAFPTVTAVDSCSAVVCAALSEREAIAGWNSDYMHDLYSHRRPSWVAVFACLATDTRQVYLTLLGQKERKKG